MISNYDAFMVFSGKELNWGEAMIFSEKNRIWGSNDILWKELYLGK